MTKETISILSTFVNLVLVILKLLVGFFINSTALIAEGIHSGLDVISSLATLIGIRSAQKPVDKEHPYGYYRFESIAGFFVVILLAISAIWIFYEGIIRLIHPEETTWSIWALVLIGASAVVNEIMARLKFYFGSKFSSLALIADGEHSRADIVSSLGVFVGLILIRFWLPADAIVAILIGIYIMYEAWHLGKETTDSLIDISDLKTEEKIQEIAQQEKIEISSLKTRKIGPSTFAELKIKLPSQLKVAEASKTTDQLEGKLISSIEQLKSINISVESHEFERSTVKSAWGKNFQYRRGFEPIELKKLGNRIIIPLNNAGKISNEFGAPKYLVIDKDANSKTQRKDVIKNKFFEERAGHGVKFAKAISADEVIASHIGLSAQQNLKAAGINFKILIDQKEIEKCIK